MRGEKAQVNTKALLSALQSGQIAGAGLDTLEIEPVTRDNYGALLDLDNVVVTPHTSVPPLLFLPATSLTHIVTPCKKWGGHAGSAERKLRRSRKDSSPLLDDWRAWRVRKQDHTGTHIDLIREVSRVTA